MLCAARALKPGYLPPRCLAQVSAHILVVCSHRSYKVKRSRAKLKVKRGGFHWDGDFIIREILPVVAARRIFSDPPSGAAFVWAPKPSGNYIVMQAKWGL